MNRLTRLVDEIYGIGVVAYYVAYYRRMPIEKLRRLLLQVMSSTPRRRRDLPSTPYRRVNRRLIDEMMMDLNPSSAQLAVRSAKAVVCTAQDLDGLTLGELKRVRDEVQAAYDALCEHYPLDALAVG